ncbi:LysR family transcriptional regulator ArgP [Spirochaetota bacterium]
MLDYQLVEAFAVVLEEGGFAKAAERLFVTQSAVSQRVKLLEDSLGKTLISRGSPLKATAAGETLFRHYKQIISMEEETLGGLGAKYSDKFNAAPHLQIAVNIDSLHVWFLEAAAPLVNKYGFTLEVFMAGHAQTIDLLKAGAVYACISSQRQPVDGCTVDILGPLKYALVASGDFAGRYFADGFSREAACRAPVVDLDRQDSMQRNVLFKAFGDPQICPPIQYFPTADSYDRAIRAGLGYGLVPVVNIRKELEEGSLVELDKSLRIELSLYWHAWKHSASTFKNFSGDFVETASRLLDLC